MKIRSITGFIDPGWPLDIPRLAGTTDSLKAAREALTQAGYDIQTLRLATPPPAEMTPAVPPSQRPKFAAALEAECFVLGIDYISIGPALPGETEGYAIIPEILAATESVFASGIFADERDGLSIKAARACASVIQQASTISPDGFANLRFSALSNVPSGVPFFPAAYHRGGPAAFGVATEAAALAVTATENGTSMHSVRTRLIEAIEGHATVISRTLERIASAQDIRYLGIDFSLAQFPERARSLGTAFENLGVRSIGLAGSAAAAAFLADCIDRAKFRRTGFCGLFLPVLEDSVLAARAAEGILTLSDLLLYSTLCGTGLDTIPLPGDTSIDELTALLFDVGAISLRHSKPLTARLMPIPGQSAGDEIVFDFPYFASSRVMAIDSHPLGGVLGGSDFLDIRPRN
jgi:uncharacterized protein